MLKNLSSLVWITPFLSCLLGYLATSLFFIDQTFQTPSLLGKNISQAVHELSSLHLNPRIVRYHEDADLPESTIIDQTPSPGQSIRPGHHIFLSLTRHPPTPSTPCLHGLTISQAQEKAHPNKIKSYAIVNNQKKGIVLAQLPHPDTPLKSSILHLYTASGAETSIIVPSFKNLPLPDVIACLNAWGFSYDILNAKEAHDTSVVHQQKPLAGSIISRLSPPRFQISIGSSYLT